MKTLITVIICFVLTATATATELKKVILEDKIDINYLNVSLIQSVLSLNYEKAECISNKKFIFKIDDIKSCISDEEYNNAIKIVGISHTYFNSQKYLSGSDMLHIIELENNNKNELIVKYFLDKFTNENVKAFLSDAANYEQNDYNKLEILNTLYLEEYKISDILSLTIQIEEIAKRNSIDFPPKNAQWLVDRALKFMNKYKYGLAAKDYENAYKYNNDITILISAADAWEKNGSPNSAIEIYEKAILVADNEEVKSLIKTKLDAAIDQYNTVKEADNDILNKKFKDASNKYYNLWVKYKIPIYILTAGKAIDVTFIGDPGKATELYKEYYSVEPNQNIRWFIEQRSLGKFFPYNPELIPDKRFFTMENDQVGRRDLFDGKVLNFYINQSCDSYCYSDYNSNDRCWTYSLPNGFVYESYNVKVNTNTDDAGYEVKLSPSKRNLFVRGYANSSSECFCFLGSHGPRTWIGFDVFTKIKYSNTLGDVPKEINTLCKQEKKKDEPFTYNGKRLAPPNSICHKNISNYTEHRVKCSNSTKKGRCYNWETAVGEHCYILCDSDYDVCAGKNGQ